MPSLGDSAVIIFLGLLLFGPKGLAQIARQLGKLMGEFRRASNEFRMQMEEELRIAEQADRQKEIAAIEAAAPPPPAVLSAPAATPSSEASADEHPHLRSAPEGWLAEPPAEANALPPAETAPLPIATSGELSIMPPATGLPTPRGSSPSSLSSLIESVPHMDAPNGHVDPATSDGSEQKPMRYTNHHDDHAGHSEAIETPATTESVHG
jgi:sec-independent protein translocase protein TatB